MGEGRIVLCLHCSGTGIDHNDCEWLCVTCMGRGEYEIEYEEEPSDEIPESP